MTEQLRPAPGRARPLVLAALLLALLPGAATAQHSMSQAVAETFADPQAAGERAPATAALVTATADTNLQPAEPAPLAYHTPPPVYPATASPPPASAPGQSLARMLDGLHELIIPAERLQAIPPPDPDMDCVALYRRTGQLLRLGERYRPAFQDDPRNKAIGVIGLTYTPVFYLWGVTSYAAWFEDNHRAEARERVSEVRRLMADRRCFARD